VKICVQLLGAYLQFADQEFTDKETKFLKYMIQRQKNGELSLYGYERKLFQGATKWVFVPYSR
jgi:hypothetical protein